MKDIILTVLTSEGCGHCHHLRGDGELGNGKQFMTYEHIKSHIQPIEGGKMARLWNIHFQQMSGKLEVIESISKIYMENGVIYQEKYFNEGGKVRVKISVLGVNNNRKELSIKDADVKEGWLDFVKSKVPRGIENYTFYFPCFIVFDYEDWKKGENILGITNAGFTMRDAQGVHMLEKNGQTIQQRNVPASKLVTEAISGVLQFVPHKDLFQEEKPPPVENPSAEKPREEKPPSVEKPQEEKPPPVKQNKCGFVIRNYDYEEY